jgi:peptide subunit release factor 1 (eRF1)
MSGKNEQPNEAEKNIEIWKVKKLIKRLEAARGNGTSMISLIIRMSPPRSEPPAHRLTIQSSQGSDLARCQDVG